MSQQASGSHTDFTLKSWHIVVIVIGIFLPILMVLFREGIIPWMKIVEVLVGTR